MKRILIVITCMILVSMTGCQGDDKTTDIEKLWKAAREADSIEAYAEEQMEAQAHLEEVALEALQTGDTPLEQQFQATALLCAVEYQSYLSENEGSSWEDDLFQFDYPVSAPYAESYLAKVDTEGEAFWIAMEGAFFPYDCLKPMFAAAHKLESQTLINLATGGTEDGTFFKQEMEDEVETWLQNNPGELITVGDALMESGYFDNWSLDDWCWTFLNDSLVPERNREAALEDALAYVNYIRNSMLPAVEGKYGDESFRSESEIIQEDYYTSGLMVTVDEEVKFQEKLESQEQEEREQPETVEIEGKKVIALYRNLQSEEFEGSPAPLRLIGDFMLELTEEEYPKSVEEADYYLILTANYEEGGFYQNQDGSEAENQIINSSTSVDLYEAGTGAFLRHLGNVWETAPESIFTSDDDNAAQYPEIAGADVLTYIYRHINEPDAYAFLIDNLSGKGEVAIDEPVILAGWEIIYHSAEIVREFENKGLVCTASDGCRIVRGKFTITNRGQERDTFLPIVYYIGEEPIVQVTDETHKDYYNCLNVMGYGPCLSNTSLDPGESKDGELIFEIPDELVQEGTPLYIAVSLGDRMVFYPLS